MHQRIRRFSRILKLREDDRRNEQTLLAAERQEERDVLNRLSALEGEKTQAIEKFCGCGGKTLSCTELWFQRQSISAIENRITAGKDSLQDVRQRILGTEARLIDRHKDVKIMETYVNQLKVADFKEQVEAEQLELDDLAMVQYTRARREGL